MVTQVPSSNIAECALKNHCSYFSWLCQQSGLEGPLARIFYETDFRWVDGMNDDEERAKQAKDLRELYAIYLIAGDQVSTAIDKDQWHAIDILKKSILGPACVFEVFVGLARELDSMLNTGSEPEVQRWFGRMMDNADFSFYDESDWDGDQEKIEKYWKAHLDRILDRKYLKDGEGGLFPLSEPQFDAVQRSLWDQMNDWAEENMGQEFTEDFEY